MTTKCFDLVRGRRLRVTALDDCGRLVYGDGVVGVAKAFVSIGLTANTTTSDEISVTDADGEVVVLEAEEDSLTSYSAEIVFRRVDPEVYNIITGQNVYRNYAGDIVGLVVNTKIKAKRFALEIWAGVNGGDACDNPAATGDYGYMLLPNVKGGVVGDVTIENGAINFTISGARSLDGNRWGRGPYDVMLNDAVTPVPAPLPTALDKDDHYLVIAVDVAPPAVVCGARPLLDPTEEALTSISGAVVGSTATFTPTPADISAPAYYEFGDGEYAYLSAGSLAATSHTYDEPGTYTVKATTNNTVVTTTVTIAA
jgi:hypothetical protein